jgi:hypothetical protein
MYTFLSQHPVFDRQIIAPTPLYYARNKDAASLTATEYSFRNGGVDTESACRHLLHFTQSVTHDRAFSLVELEFGDTPLDGIPPCSPVSTWTTFVFGLVEFFKLDET